MNVKNIIFNTIIKIFHYFNFDLFPCFYPDNYLTLKKKGLKFSEDLLFTYNNADFINESKFVKSYNIAKKVDNNNLLVNYNIKWRMHVLFWAASHAIKLDGDFIDFGVHTGFCARAVMDYVNFKKTNKTYYLLDTFSGMNPNYSDKYEMQRSHNLGYGKNVNLYNEVCRTFDGFNVKIIKGPVPETLPMIKSTKFCYVSVDMNSVIPEYKSLEFIWDKVVPGGVIILDDYGYPGAEKQKEAHDKFSKKHKVSILTLPTSQGLIIKP